MPFDHQPAPKTPAPAPTVAAPAPTTDAASPYGNAFAQDQLPATESSSTEPWFRWMDSPMVGAKTATSAVPDGGYKPEEQSSLSAGAGAYSGDLGVGVQAQAGGRLRVDDVASIEAKTRVVAGSRGAHVSASVAGSFDVGSAEATAGVGGSHEAGARIEYGADGPVLVARYAGSGEAKLGANVGNDTLGAELEGGFGASVEWRRPVSDVEAAAIEHDLDAGGPAAALARVGMEADALHTRASEGDDYGFGSADLLPGERLTTTRSMKIEGGVDVAGVGVDGGITATRRTSAERTPDGVALRVRVKSETTGGGNAGVPGAFSAAIDHTATSTSSREITLFVPNDADSAEVEAVLDVWTIDELGAAALDPSVAGYVTSDVTTEGSTASTGLEVHTPVGIEGQVRTGSFSNETRGADGSTTREAGAADGASVRIGSLALSDSQRESLVYTEQNGEITSFRIGGTRAGTATNWPAVAAAVATAAVHPASVVPALMAGQYTTTTEASGGIAVTPAELAAFVSRATSNPAAWRHALRHGDGSGSLNDALVAWNALPDQLAAAGSLADQAEILHDYVAMHPRTGIASIQAALTEWGVNDWTGDGAIPGSDLGTHEEWPAELQGDKEVWERTQDRMDRIDTLCRDGQHDDLLAAWSDLDHLDVALSDADFADPHARLDMLEQVWRWQIALQQRGVQAPWAATEPTDEVALQERVVANAQSHTHEAITDSETAGFSPDLFLQAGSEIDAWAEERDALRELYVSSGVPADAWLVAQDAGLEQRAHDVDLARYAAAGRRISRGTPINPDRLR